MRSILIIIITMKMAFASSSDSCFKVLKEKGDEQARLCLRRLDIRQIDFWKKRIRKGLKDKVFIAGQRIHFYVSSENKTWGYPERPFLVKRDLHYMKKLVSEVLVSLPVQIKNLLDHRFGGVGLLENFGGTGYSTTILNKKNKIIGSFLLLDPRKLIKKANEWNTWKERTPFKKGRYTLIANIEENKENSIKGAIRYILLHEIGHIISNNLRHLPPWEEGLSYERPISDKNYENFSWVKKNRTYKTKQLFLNRKKVKYYWGPQLSNDQIIKIYSSLEESSFPTLYAATSIWDDYADSFANYVHVNLLKKQWNIEIYDSKKLIKVVGHCWNDKRCHSKKRFFDSLLSSIAN